MSRRYVGAVAGAFIGALVGATVGGLVGRLIALVGDETVAPVVPMAFCATLGYVIGAASGAKGSLDRIGSQRSAAGSVVAGLVLLVSVVAAVYLGSDTVAVFVVVLLAGLVLSAVLAAAVSGPGRASAGGPEVSGEARAPRLEVTRQTIAPPPRPEPREERVESPPIFTIEEDEDDAASEAIDDTEPAEAVEDAGAVEDTETVEDGEVPLPQSESRPSRPRRERPLRVERGAPERTAEPADPSPAEAPPAEAPKAAPAGRPVPTRPRRSRPLRAGDVTDE